MVPFEIVFTVVVGLSVASGVVATAVALTVDTRRRPAARTLVDRLRRLLCSGRQRSWRCWRNGGLVEICPSTRICLGPAARWPVRSGVDAARQANHRLLLGRYRLNNPELVLHRVGSCVLLRMKVG